uniref:Uncharacterized protein n=1 Tax=uncultured marine bacterium MedDCM-OCT-S05-C114 TaxID=743063 RepID=D6PDF8_9BACT|nr:hypothetical protein [uncultured marine bacterium MedDCM-OCT-S05-C114]
MLVKLELEYKNFALSLLEEIEKFATSTNVDASIASTVSEILQDVKTHGDQALVERTSLYDKANLNKSELRVPSYQIEQASSSLSSAHQAAIEDAIEM